MARQRKAQTTEEQIEKMEAIVLQRKAAYDEAVANLKELRKKKEKIRRHYFGRLLPANGATRRSWHSSRVAPMMLTNKNTKLLLSHLINWIG